MDYEDWIMQRCDELAEQLYHKPYEELTDSQQLILWAEAEDDYINNKAARIDAAYDAALEQRMLDSLERKEEADGN